MDDLITELAAENPVPECEAPPIEAVWHKLEAPPRRTRTVVPLLLGAVIVPALIAAVLLADARHGRRMTVAGAPSCRLGHTVLGGTAPRQAGPPDAQILALIGVLRRAPGPRDRGHAACLAARFALSGPIPVSARRIVFLRADPVYVRYVGPGPFGGSEFIYPLPSAPRTLVALAVAHGYGPVVDQLREPSVCLITVGGDAASRETGTGGSASGCTSLRSLRARRPSFPASHVAGEPSGSLLAGVVRDGVALIAVYRGHRRIATVPVRDNAAYFHTPLPPPPAAHLRLSYVSVTPRH